jgi:predicted ATPase
MLRRLAVFAGGFTLEAAETVCADGIVDAYGVFEVLSRLVDKSLVQADVTQGEGRYRLLETIRAYAQAKLLEAGESETTRDRHRDYFLAFAERVEPELMLRDGKVWLNRLELERENLFSSAAPRWAANWGTTGPWPTA